MTTAFGSPSVSIRIASCPFVTSRMSSPNRSLASASEIRTIETSCHIVDHQLLDDPPPPKLPPPPENPPPPPKPPPPPRQPPPPPQPGPIHQPPGPRKRPEEGGRGRIIRRIGKRISQTPAAISPTIGLASKPRKKRTGSITI